MSLIRVVSAARHGSPQFATRAVLTSVSTNCVLKRTFWWRRKSDEKDKSDKTKPQQAEKDVKKTESNLKEILSTKPDGNAAFLGSLPNNKQLNDDFAQFNDAGVQAEPMPFGMEEVTEIPPPPVMGGGPFKQFPTIMAPRPVHLKEDMVIPAIPLPLRPLLPGFVQNLVISDRATIQKLREVFNSSNRCVGMFLRKEKFSNDLADHPDVIRNIKEIFEAGTCAEIQNFQMTGTNASILFLGRSRIQIKECVQVGPPTLIKAKPLTLLMHDLDDVTMGAYMNEISSYTRLVSSMNPILGDYLSLFMQRHEIDNPLYLADYAGGLSLESRELQQKLLESPSCIERFDVALKLFNKELQTIRMQQSIKQQVEANTKDTERKYMLKEQMKVIQKELGGNKDPKQSYIDQVNEKLAEMEKRKVSDAAINAIKEELARLNYTDIQSAEYSIIRNYLEWVTGIPWNVLGPDQMNLTFAEKVLNEDHYGLKDVKDRILEFIAVGKLQGHIPGKVLCFVGPPGTGKTSIAKSIARALGREYFQFSVGGANDVAQIKGFRRTYLGSMPGKLIHCLKTTKVNNPLVLIDEVDKLSASHHGDPASALLEVLDPNQNNAFMDNYLDIPVDFSKALFVCTANDLNTIPQPLLDRMEVIRISGYDYREKLEISKHYLDKKARAATGLERGKKTTPASLEITDEALTSLIRWYCREAGVRNLEKYIEKIYRKIAMRIATMTAEDIANTDFTVRESDLETYVGKKIFLSDRLYDQTPAGVVMGLAWTSMGGATLYIECQTVKPHPLDQTLTQYLQSTVEQGCGEENGEEADTTSTSTIATITNITNNTPSLSASSCSCSCSCSSPKSSTSTTTTVGHLTMTGQLGDIMKESITIAYLNARRWMQRLSYSPVLYNSLISSFNAVKATSEMNDDMTGSQQEKGLLPTPSKETIFNILETSDFHMHLPEGATPKDGPSAGCAITTALLSTALNRPIKQGIAMTGEISLNGKVLPVGGIKEKVMAARRAGINEIILPAENCRDVNELPDYVKENLEIHYAKTYEDVLRYTELCSELFH